MKQPYFAFVDSKNIIHVLSEMRYLPHIDEVYQKFGQSSGDTIIIRLLGRDRKEIEKLSGEEWNKLVSQLIDEPRLPDAPLSQIYRVKNIRELYYRPLMFHATPCILSPSTAKILYVGMLKDFRRGFNNAGVLNFGQSVIGYSLPQQDEYMHHALYTLVTNYQRNHWDKGM